jgi:anion-transporting  ArsA/GET3 family ATPase
MTEVAAGLALRTADDLFDELSGRKFVIVSGKGGVGRTTIAALSGVALAERGRKVLVATTGHDDRLAWMLGAAALSDAPPRLWIQRLVPTTCIREYGALVLRSSRLSSAVFDNRVVAPLLRAIPGLDDFSLLGKAWHDAFRGGAYDTVVFDGPATGHLLYSIGVPQAILQTIAPGPLTREAELMRTHFQDPRSTAAVLVGLPETWPLTELGELGTALHEQQRIAIAAVVVNGLWPADVPPLPGDHAGALAPLFAAVDRAGSVGRRQRAELAAWRGGQGAARCGSRRLVVVPHRFGGIADVTALRSLLEFPRGPVLAHAEVAS